MSDTAGEAGRTDRRYNCQVSRSAQTDKLRQVRRESVEALRRSESRAYLSKHLYASRARTSVWRWHQNLTHHSRLWIGSTASAKSIHQRQRTTSEAQL